MRAPGLNRRQVVALQKGVKFRVVIGGGNPAPCYDIRERWPGLNIREPRSRGPHLGAVLCLSQARPQMRRASPPAVPPLELGPQLSEVLLDKFNPRGGHVSCHRRMHGVGQFQ